MEIFTDLEIRLDCNDGVCNEKSSYAIEARFSSSDSRTSPRPAFGEARFDFETLLKQLEPMPYGQLLCDSLFANSSIQGIFSKSLTTAQALDVPLHMRLFISERAAKLHELRWELLLNPEDRTSLLTTEHILFSRYLDSGDWTPVKPLRKKELRVLVVIASPTDLERYRLDPINVSAEQARAESNLQAAMKKILASNGTATLDNLVDQLREGEGYNILYVVCHGALIKGQPKIWLENPNGQADVVAGDVFVSRLRELKQRPQLIVLASCQSAGSGQGSQSRDSGVLAALGPQLSAAGIPAVIAMQGDILQGTLEKFMPLFFKQLYEHGQLDRAMAVARSEIKDRSDYWVPVLFMRFSDGHLWEDEVAQQGTFTAPPSSIERLFGRDELLHTLRDRLCDPKNKSSTILMQLPGVGKTELAMYLANDPKIVEHFRDGVLWAGLGSAPDMDALLGEWASALGIASNEISALKTSDANPRAVHKKISRAVHAKIGSRRMLLIIDDAWQGEAAMYFVIGANCSRIITTRSATVAANIDGVTEQIQVPELDEQDGVALLEYLAPQAVKAEPDRCRRLVATVGSLPLALVLTGKYLRNASRSSQPQRIQSAWSTLQKVEDRLNLSASGRPWRTEDRPDTLGEIIAMSDEALSDEREWHGLGKENHRTLLACSVFRAKPHQFTLDAAKEVCESTDETIYNLENYGMLEAIKDVDAFCMPRTIADYARGQLTKEESQKRHQRAANYYAKRLRGYEEDSRHATSYERMYSYESLEWQAMKSAWLYHEAHLQNRTEANLTMAKIFLDAFWWWRCYDEQFPFCAELLEQWRQHQAEGDPNAFEEDRTWLKLLTEFQNAYPTGYQKAGKGNWQQVGETLDQLRKLGGLDADLATLDLQRRHIRAITDIFLAESWRFREVDDPRADQCYQEALTIFEQGDDDDDGWNLPWVLWHLSDLCLERCQGETALQFVQKSLAAVADYNARADKNDPHKKDYEIIANNFRVRADVFWRQNDLEKAFDNYARAVFHAYIFQAYPKSPDFYTIEFYDEMTTRTIEALHSLWQTGRKDEAAQACAALRSFWKPYWDSFDRLTDAVAVETLLNESRLQELATYLFPPCPSEQDRRVGEASNYYKKVSEMFTAIGDSIGTGT